MPVITSKFGTWNWYWLLKLLKLLLIKLVFQTGIKIIKIIKTVANNLNIYIYKNPVDF